MHLHRSDRGPLQVSFNRKQFAIPLHSMSDVAFLLLIFIMLVSIPNYRTSIQIDYPETDIAKQLGENTFEIEVGRGGELYLEGNLMTLEEVEEEITEIYNQDPDRRIHIAADRNTSFEHVFQLLKYLQFLRHRMVSFAAKNVVN